MSRLTELIKQHGFSTAQYGSWAKLEKADWPARRDMLVKVYGPKVRCEETNYGAYSNYYSTSATVYCREDNKCNHYLYMYADGFAYNWPGQNYLISKTPIPIDLLHELSSEKEKELEAARKKRFETIKSPRDAIRIIFRDLGIKVQMVSGSPRLDVGPCDIEFSASKDDSDPQVTVSFIYRSGDYKSSILLTKLSIADPNFSKKVEAIVFNGQNLNKLMLGEAQPRSLDFK